MGLDSGFRTSGNRLSFQKRNLTMGQPENVKEFMFKTAQYYVSDGNGTTVVLQIDYENNRYAIDKNETQLRPAFARELARIAADLLGRKHGVNFAARVTR